MPPNITLYHDSVYEQGFECPLITDSNVATKLTTFNLYKEKDEDPSMRLNCITSVTKCLPKVKRQFHIYPLLSSINFCKYDHKKVSKRNPDPLLLAIEQAREVNGKSNSSKVCFDYSKNEIIDGKTESPNKSLRQTASSTDVSVSVRSIRNDSSNCKQESKTLAGWNMSFPTDQSLNSHNESKLLSRQIQSILQKGQKELFKFNYTDAAPYFVTALEKLKKHGYPPHHSLQKKTFDSLQYTYHAEKTMEYSVQIVKMGLRHEARGEFSKALKKYTVAYQMRKELFAHPLHLQVSRLDDQPRRHPSLAVLLNLLGGVRLKMGELDEALQLYVLSLYGQRDSRDIIIQDTTAPGTTAVTMREIGSIYEQQGDLDLALKYYLDSLDFVLSSTCYRNNLRKRIYGRSVSYSHVGHTVNSILNPDVSIIHASSGAETPNEEMEVYIQKSENDSKIRSKCNLVTYYEGFFQKKITKTSDPEKNLMIHVATTLQCIANVHKRQGDRSVTIGSYKAALRGMKACYGDKHSNVASILSNFGTFLKDIKEYKKKRSIFMKKF